jgi:cytochrome c
MRSATILVLLGAACAARAAPADDAELARAKKCMNCHAVDQKLVGPAFKSVAARYADDHEAEARLATKIREGGAGSWGVVPMPANAITQAEAQRLAHWVLMQK